MEPNKPTDDLAAKTDHELNLIFETDVLGFEPLSLAMASTDGGKSGCLFESNPYQNDSFPINRRAIEDHCRQYPQYKVVLHQVPRSRYCSSADAILSHLETWAAWSKGTVGSSVTVYDRRPSSAFPEDPPSEWILQPIGHFSDWNSAVPFPRAAVIAMIRGKRAAQKTIQPTSP